MKKPLPIGRDNFKDIRRNDFYYVDKTLLIQELLDKKGEVRLFTRPRRFGKTLNLSMLRYYFEDTKDEEENQQNRKLFSGLAIGAAGEQYRREQCQYPVIMVTLKSAKQPTYENAMHCLQETLADEYARHEAQVEGNLLRVYSILNGNYSGYFGFVEREVKEMLAHYGRAGNLQTVKDWYDGYCFGETEVSKFLEETISYFDYGESYYHGFLAGLLKRNGKYRIQSNRETGLGRADLILKTPKVRNGRAVVLELKVVKRFQEMEKGCREALRQIEEKKYKDALRQEGYEDILAYGICFYQKECMVQMPLDGRN